MRVVFLFSDKERPRCALVLDSGASNGLIAAVKALQGDLEAHFRLRLPLVVGHPSDLWLFSGCRCLFIGEYRSFLSAEWAGPLGGLSGLDPPPGLESFVVGMTEPGPEGERHLACLGGGEPGTRYGLIEIRRRLCETAGGVGLELPAAPAEFALVRTPRFSFRGLLISPSPRAQGYYSPAQWDATTWARYIEMLAFFRLNVLGLWGYPPPFNSLRAPEGSAEVERFIGLTHQIISMAHEAGLQVLVQAPPHGYLDGHQLCPQDPHGREQIRRTDEFFIRNLREADFFELFPGHGGGCMCGRCNEGTFLELALASAECIAHCSQAKIVLNTWMGLDAWGDQWTDRETFDHLVRRLPDFPRDMRVAVGERIDDEWANAIAQTHHLISSNGDTESVQLSDPLPQFRLRTVQRHLQMRVCPYPRFDGAIYNLHTPALGLLNCFGAAEFLWDPLRPIDEICAEFVQGLGLGPSDELWRALRDLGTVYSKDDRHDYPEGSGPRLTLLPSDLAVVSDARQVIEEALATARASLAGENNAPHCAAAAWPLAVSPPELLSEYRAAADLYRQALPAVFIMDRLLATPKTPENRAALLRLVADLRQCELEKIIPPFYERRSPGEHGALWEVYDAYRFWLEPEAILGPSLASSSLGAVVTTSSVHTYAPRPAHSPRRAEEPPASQQTFKYAQIAHLNDGIYGPSSLWIGATPNNGWVTIDLGRERHCDRLLFSRNRPLAEINPHDYLDGLPRDFTVEVSRDGQAWQPVVNVADNSHNRCIIRFPSRVSARYIRLNILATIDGKRPCLDEVEVLDTGGEG